MSFQVMSLSGRDSFRNSTDASWMLSREASKVIFDESSFNTLVIKFAKLTFLSFISWLIGGTLSGKVAVNSCFLIVFSSRGPYELFNIFS